MLTLHGRAKTYSIEASQVSVSPAGEISHQEIFSVQASTLPLELDPTKDRFEGSKYETIPVTQITYIGRTEALLAATRGSTTHRIVYRLLQGDELPEFFKDDNYELAPEVARTQEMLGALLSEVRSFGDLQRVLQHHFYNAVNDEIQLSDEMTKVFAYANEILGLQHFRDWADFEFMKRVNTYMNQHSILPDNDGHLPDMGAVVRGIEFNRDAQLRLMVVEVLMMKHLCENPHLVPELSDLMVGGPQSWYEKTVSTLPRSITDGHFERVISPYIHELEMRRRQIPSLEKYSLKDLLRGGIPDELYTKLQDELPDEIFQLINEVSINDLHPIDSRLNTLIQEHAISGELKEEIISAAMINALSKGINSFIHAKFIAAPLRTRVDILRASALELNSSIRPGDTFYTEIFATGASFEQFLRENGVESIDLTSATDLARIQALGVEYLAHHPEVKLECIELKTGDRSLNCNIEGRKEIRRWLAISLSMFHETGLPHSQFIDWMQSAENPLLLLSSAGIGKFGSRIVGLLGSPRPYPKGEESVQRDTASTSPSQFLPSTHQLTYHTIIKEMCNEYHLLIEEIDLYYSHVCSASVAKSKPSA